MINTCICTIFYSLDKAYRLHLRDITVENENKDTLMNDKTMKCTSLLFSLWVIVTSVAAQPNYDFTKLKREHLGRGVIAIRENPSTVAVSWRYLSSDPMDEAFDVYRDGKKVNKHPLKNATFFQDSYQGTEPALYTVKAVKGKTESKYQDRKSVV